MNVLGPARMTGLFCIVALLLVACSGEPSQKLEPVYDLAALLPTAEVVSEPRAITFETPEDRQHLHSGWSRFERSPRGGFAWGLRQASTVEFHLLAPRAFDLRLEGRPLRAPEMPPQVVTARINGSSLEEIELQPGLGTYTLPVPAEHVSAGLNRLELAYRWSQTPRQASGAKDWRELAVAWHHIGFGMEGPSLAPRAVAGEPIKLFLPAGSEASYYVELSPGSRLFLDGWSWKEATGRLDIEVRAEHQDPISVAGFEGSGKETSLALPAEGIVRLTLRALPSPDAAPSGGVELLAPTVWMPRSESPTEPAPAVAEVTESPARPNIVLYLIDTLRADRLGCYGYPRPVSPRIDAFAESAVLFEQVAAQSSWTRSSMASVFTGRWPPAHGIHSRDDRLAGDLPILPELLRGAGYHTAAFITNPNLGPVFGFDRGYDDYTLMSKAVGSDSVFEEVNSWLDARSDPAPFFLWVHTVDPHAPYFAPEPFAGRLAPGVSAEAGRRSLDVLNDLQAGRRELDAGTLDDLQALYDATIAHNDHYFGTFLDELNTRGLLDDALVILLSDHGDEFHEHGNWQHGRALHTESIDVPLIVKLPAAGEEHRGQRVAQRVRQVDLLPTILDLLGLPSDPGVEGQSLLPLIAGSTTETPPAFSYLHLDGPARVSVTADGWKLIQRFEHERLTRPRLYHVAEDPGETRELAADLPVRTGYLASMIRGKLAGQRVQAETAEIDEATRKALEALGYL